MTTHITQSQLESYLWGAAVLLRGTIDAGDYKQFIFPLLFYKRLCDVFDEETQTALAESEGDKDFAAFPENHRFQIPPETHWREVRKIARDVGSALQSALRSIETANPDKLYGIFGDAQWTNKDRLSDVMLHDLIEHFSALELTVSNLPEDELGQGYEYLIKKFADDSGHTAAEFYTNRTVVHLMTELLQPQPGESIYDPTCGSGGMLLSCIAQLRRQGKEWRNVRLYGQERNLMTSSIARMNCFLHGIEDFSIERGDTLSEPKFVEGDRLMQFDVVLANPPYSIKQWDRAAFASDPWGRNIFGTPPQGRADYAFWQHIICSLAPETGRCAILFPHGVLFRQEEAEMRRKLIEADLIECVLGLGPNLFYNSPMEACVVICCMNKPEERRGKILFINAVNEVIRERAQSFLTLEHVEHIVNACNNFKDETDFACVATLEEIRAQDSSLSIPLYVTSTQSAGFVLDKEETTYRIDDISLALSAWLTSRKNVADSLHSILPDISSVDETLNKPKTCAILDRSTWQHVCFGDLVQNMNETERNPAERGIERFIGLEHMEPGSLHIRSWGNVSDGTTFVRRCRLGQVLFGKRRAYQRKVAVAEFDAVVSGDIYVFAPKDDRLLPELLPFLCMSERFFQHAVGTSAGSLSPRTSWSSLAKFELYLPPLDQQQRIAKILWAIDDIISAWKKIKENVHILQESKLKKLFIINSTHWPHRALSDIARVERGKFSHRPRNLPEFYGGVHPFVQTSDVQNSDRVLNRFEYKLTDLGTTYSKQFPAGTILVTIAAVIGATAITEHSVYVTDSVVGVVPFDGMDIDYLELFLRHQRQFLESKAATQTAQKNINLQVLRPLEVPCPPLSVQKAIAEEILSLFKFTDKITINIINIYSMLNALINKIMEINEK